uniref:insect group II chitinase n=1 Tax=Ostrinia furnacalis TaxID=93504 RepID=UPI000C810916|nr:Chain A, insect group II chitinase [Ostrinia furnacalis]5Y2C_B Chain B, insect group II chitinase [Ostrinia furnacalis]
ERFKVVCYYTNWAWYRPDNGKYTPGDINPELCTHIIYAFAVLDKEELVIKSHDIWLDVENKFYEKVTALKSHGVKVLLGLGGWDDSAGDKYSRLVNNVSARRKFVVHAVDFLEQYGFDGLDLDWLYPKCWQVECEKGPDSDKQGFADLVKELRKAFNRRGMLLSAAVSASKRVIDYAYNVPALSMNLDWISLMTYDYHGQWDKKTGHVAPMYVHDKDTDNTFNVNFTVNYWINKGADRKKLVVGVPFYGQSFSVVEGAGTGLGAPTYAGGEAGDETRARGFLSFYEICERVKVKGWKVHRDPGGRIGPYATHDDQWVSFDDDFMARHKAEYVRAMELGGSMAWSLDLDDFTGKYCGCGKAPLLTTINHVLRGKEAPPPCILHE